MRQRSFMVEHAAEIPAIDPAAASLSFHEVVGVVVIATNRSADELAARDYPVFDEIVRHSGIVTSDALQAGQGAPAPPQLQARGPSHGLSGWFSQTHR